MKKISLLLIPLILASCATPSRLGISYKGKQVVSSASNLERNPNIDLYVNSLTKEDRPIDLEILKSRFISYANRNVGLTELIAKNPDTKIKMEVTPSEEKESVWILNALFFYPGWGFLMPYTPWWGKVNLAATLSITIPFKNNSEFNFRSSEPYRINSYPYYRAGKILTEKYSVSYDTLFEQVRKHDFSDFLEETNQIKLSAVTVIADSVKTVKQNDINISYDNDKLKPADTMIVSGLPLTNESYPGVVVEKQEPLSAEVIFDTPPYSIDSINWKKTHKLIYSMSIGLGSGEKINTHIQTTYGYGSSDEYISGLTFSYSLLTLSYYHFKNITFHFIIAPIINNQTIGDVKDFESKSQLFVNRFKTQINIFHKESITDSQGSGEIINGYLGYGIGGNSFKFFRKTPDIDTKVTYHPSLGHSVSLGYETFVYDMTGFFFGFFAEINYYIGNMELRKVVENGVEYSKLNLPSAFSDWKTYNPNRIDVQFGIRFSLLGPIQMFKH